MSPEIPEIYANRVRVRVCGLCWKGEKLLMVNHRGLTSGSFWSPPGGGIEFGETVQEALVREFLEETRVDILPEQFRFVCEYIQQPLHSGQASVHAIEVFFAVDYLKGEALKGSDPESDADNQIITDVKYMSMTEILALPADERHGIFRLVKSAADLKSLTGFYRI
jgi:8-oxo-dGTP diphosphatase